MVKRLLIANRGEVAIRVARTAADLGIETVAVFPDDDRTGLHTRIADQAHRLPGRGVAAYLDQQAVLDAARETGVDAIHPGYGFLSENSAFAAACAKAGILFIGPEAETLALLGDKTRAKELAITLGAPVIEGRARETALDEAGAFLAELQSRLGPDAGVMVKAVAGGGGRGIRAVTDPAALEEAYARCAAEAEAAFGDGALYVERFIPRARHLEVQILGDGSGAAVHLWERDCSLQRRNQKLVEIAPSPRLSPAIREAMLETALKIARETRYRGLGTFEFLVDEAAESRAAKPEDAFAFIEANPRLQVEHTVTEMVTGLDLVALQIRVCAGESLEDLGLDQSRVPQPRGFAIQTRVNLETMAADGQARPSSGRLSVYEPPTGPGVRVDGCGYAGFEVNPHYDSLLAKLITHDPSGDYPAAARRAYRALSQFRLSGAASNIGFLQALLGREDVAAHQVHTRFIDEHLAALLAVDAPHPQRFFEPEATTADAAASGAGARLDGPAGTKAVPSPLTGVLVEYLVEPGQAAPAGAPIAVLEAMKMHHVVTTPIGGVLRVLKPLGEVVSEGAPLAFVEPAEIDGATAAAAEELDPDYIRPDLAEVIERHEEGLDVNRPDAVQKRRKLGKRTARENVADLVDPGSFVEYGALAVAAQRSRRSLEELRRISPADGLIAGLGSVNGALFDEDKARCAVMAYDYTVLAGTQGHMGHRKSDRLLSVAEQLELPLIAYAEGGGGRPGDVDHKPGVDLSNPTFFKFARLSGIAPLVGVVSGRCFAGNAALLGCCDVIIATEDATIGMGGPAMIEGAGLGVVKPDEVGPVAVHGPNGVIDVLVKDEVEATAMAKKYLSYFQGPLKDWTAPDQRRLRHVIPENRLRAYDVRQVIDILADEGSVLELRREFGPAMVTSLIRIEGRPVGVIANVPAVNGGAIDRDDSDKAARFMQLCDGFGLPIISLCDTPGFMVGPEAEARANVRHFARMFLIGASLQVPLFSVMLRKGYGLGAMAMTGGSFHESSQITLCWPTGEFGSMGLEGAVELAYRNELNAAPTPEARQTLYRQYVDELYDVGKAINVGPYLSVDDVIDPADTRRLLLGALKAAPRLNSPKPGRRSMIDAW